MAKQTKSTTPPATAATVPAPAPRGQGDNDVFVRTSAKLPEGKRIAPQAQVIVNAVEAAGDKGLTRAQLVKNLEGVIVTRQPIGRIVTYYQKSLTQELGLLTLTKAAAPAGAEAAK